MKTPLGVCMIVALAGCSSDSTSLARSSSATSPSPTSPALTVSGVVVDGTSGLRISGAQVEWAGLAEGWGDRGHGVFTAADGSYTMAVSPAGPGAAEGQIVMRATKSGYVTNQRRVTIALTGNTTVDFELRP